MSSVDLTDLKNEMLQYSENARVLRELNKQQKTLKSVLLDALDGHDEGLADGKVAIRKRPGSQQRISPDLIREKFPEIEDAVTVTTPTMALDILLGQ